MRALENMSISSKKYVVLDVETNGLKSKEDDLLSISIYKPDDGRKYTRFLPLDMNKDISARITAINSIKKNDLLGLKPLTQEEVDTLFTEFELSTRTILTYGSIDEKFIKEYFHRNQLIGFSRMRWFNFKHLISVTRYSDGSLSKDNLCRLFKIKGVTAVHSGINDCVLEWKLFKAIGGRNLIARMQPSGQWAISVLSPDYIVPISYLITYQNLSRIYKRPKIGYKSKLVFSLTIPSKGIQHFVSNINGIGIEELINNMLNVTGPTKEELKFLVSNSAKNVTVGHIDSYTKITPLQFNKDGSVTAMTLDPVDVNLAKNLNDSLSVARQRITPLIEFIQSKVFDNKSIRTQELSINRELGILALCDLSTAEAILEIKTTYSEKRIEEFAEQIHYEAHGRKSYLLTISRDIDTVKLNIQHVETFIDINQHFKRNNTQEDISKLLRQMNCELVDYYTSEAPIRVRCNACGNEWSVSYRRVQKGTVKCPICNSNSGSFKVKKPKLTQEEKRLNRLLCYKDKVKIKSNDKLSIIDDTFIDSRHKVTVTCKSCGHRWQRRTDHLLNRCYCPKCGAGAQH